jgi:hypothetical protein
MTRFEQNWTADVLTAFTVDGGQGLTPRQGEVDYLGTFGRMRRGSTALAALGLRLAIWMVALAPLWALGKLATFSTLARRERCELLGRLLVHHNFAVRELTMLLKLTAAIALLGTASVRARSGYDKALARPGIDSGDRLHLTMVQAMPDTVPQPPAAQVKSAAP